jgi:hypothetical protein
VKSEASAQLLQNHITGHGNEPTLSTRASSPPMIHLNITIPKPSQSGRYDTNKNSMAERKPVPKFKTKFLLQDYELLSRDRIDNFALRLAALY